MNESPLQDRYAELPMVELGDASRPLHFGDPDAELEAGRHGAALFDLSHLGILRLVGDDTMRFLNSQLTNMVRDLRPGDGNHHAITDSKGRIQGLMDLLLLASNEALLVLDGVDLEWAHDRLDMYIIMDPIELSILSGDHGVISLQGPRAEELVEAAGLPLPERTHLALEGGPIEGGLVARNDRVASQGVDLLLPAERIPPTWDALVAAGAMAAGHQTHEALRILAGLPRWPVDMSDKSFVHELGLVDRVSCFTKGCYMGQEVINRMQTMGRINKRLTTFELDSPAPVGSEVLVEDAVVGSLSSVARVGERHLALGVSRRAAWTPGTQVRVKSGELELSGRTIPTPCWAGEE